MTRSDAGKPTYIGTGEAAKILGISRVAVLKQIKSGRIRAQKIGRNYAIDLSSLSPVYTELTATDRRRVSAAVRKAVDAYGEALKRLGRE